MAIYKRGSKPRAAAAAGSGVSTYILGSGCASGLGGDQTLELSRGSRAVKPLLVSGLSSRNGYFGAAMGLTPVGCIHLTRAVPDFTGAGCLPLAAASIAASVFRKDKAPDCFQPAFCFFLAGQPSHRCHWVRNRCCRRVLLAGLLSEQVPRAALLVACPGARPAPTLESSLHGAAGG